MSQRPGQGDVVQVVPCRLRVRSRATEAGESAVDQLRVPGEAVVGTHAQPLHDPGAEPLQKGIGLFDEAKDDFDSVGFLQVQGQTGPAPGLDVPRGRRLGL